MLGWVAAVMAIVSPSHPRPAVIQRTSSSGMGLLVPRRISASGIFDFSLKARRNSAPILPSQIEPRKNSGLEAVQITYPVRGHRTHSVYSNGFSVTLYRTFVGSAE